MKRMRGVPNKGICVLLSISTIATVLVLYFVQYPALLGPAPAPRDPPPPSAHPRSSFQSAGSLLPTSPSRVRTADSPADRCLPVPFKFPVDAPLLPCSWPSSSLPPRCTHRVRASLQCGPSVRMVYDWVPVDLPPSAYRYEDPCLAMAVRDLCYRAGQDLVPNLSHFVLFGGRHLPDYTFLAVLSAVRFLQPCMVMIHTDRLPVGPYWDTLVRLIPHLILVNRTAPKVIFGHKVQVIEHSSDIARIEAVRDFGGVYQDADYLLVNPIDDLRNSSVVMGTEVRDHNYCNAILVGKAGSEFLRAWYNSYRTFNDRYWAFHSSVMPYRLHKQRPELAFKAVDTFFRFNHLNGKRLFYDRLMKWDDLHGVHLYLRFFRRYFGRRLDQQKGSLGQVARHVLYGDSQACWEGRDLGSALVRRDSTTPAAAAVP